MLNVYIPEKYHTDQRIMRVPSAYGIPMKGAIPADAKKVVWAVADRSAYELNSVSYLEYDWSDVDTLCFGGDDQILVDLEVIKPEHGVVTIPDVGWSLYVDQAMAIILDYYIRKYPNSERAANVKASEARKRSMWKGKALRETDLTIHP